MRKTGGHRNPWLSTLRWLGKFSVGCVLYYVCFISFISLSATLGHWRRGWVEGFPFLLFNPINLIPFGIYVWLTRRMKWWAFWLTAAAVGCVHGAIFAWELALPPLNRLAYSTTSLLNIQS